MDLQAIKALIQLLHETDLSEIEVEEGGKKIRICRERVSAPASVALPLASLPSPLPPSVPETVSSEGKHHLILSPIVGTFYKTHAPGAEPYVKVGDRVKKGQTLCIVEAMKLMNEIESDVDGTIAAVCVEDKSPVEYGQPLFQIEPAE